MASPTSKRLVTVRTVEAVRKRYDQKRDRANTVRQFRARNMRPIREADAKLARFAGAIPEEWPKGSNGQRHWIPREVWYAIDFCRSVASRAWTRPASYPLPGAGVIPGAPEGFRVRPPGAAGSERVVQEMLCNLQALGLISAVGMLGDAGTLAPSAKHVAIARVIGWPLVMGPIKAFPDGHMELFDDESKTWLRPSDELLRALDAEARLLDRFPSDAHEGAYLILEWQEEIERQEKRQEEYGEAVAGILERG